MTGKLLLKSLAVLLAFVVFAASCLRQGEKVRPTITSAETPEPVPVRVSDKTFKAFSHKIEEHKQFECASCHRREGKSFEMEFAGHESCVGCHLNQFTASEPTMCAICHDDLKQVPPTMNDFPHRFVEGFNMKFDHAAHARGAGRPPDGCAACHDSAGAGKTIPAGFHAHATCYTCHTPESKIGSCSVCHELRPYSRTPQSRYVFNAVFSHGDHAGVSCDDCHSVVAGTGQGRQVTNIVPREHNVAAANNCAMCHNGSRAFSGNDPLNMSSCVRCHKGSGFDMLPGSPQ
jgi:c(7)-type cytochrome triheme protein